MNAHQPICAALILAATILAANCNKEPKVDTGNVSSVPPLPNRDATQTSPLQVSVDGVSGEYLKAFVTAYDSFKEDKGVQDRKKELENYLVIFQQNAHAYLVHFVPKLGANEIVSLGGETELGQMVTYTIDKKDYHLVSKLFHK